MFFFEGRPIDALATPIGSRRGRASRASAKRKTRHRLRRQVKLVTPSRLLRPGSHEARSTMQRNRYNSVTVKRASDGTRGSSAVETTHRRREEEKAGRILDSRARAKRSATSGPHSSARQINTRRAPLAAPRHGRAADNIHHPGRARVCLYSGGTPRRACERVAVIAGLLFLSPFIACSLSSSPSSDRRRSLSNSPDGPSRFEAIKRGGRAFSGGAFLL